MPPLSLVDLPNELLEAIILHLDPHSLISVSQANKFLKRLTTDAPIIWRHLCRTQFNEWDVHHNIATKFAGPLSDVDWRSLYLYRVKTQVQTRELLQHIVNTQQGRIKYINDVAYYGYDARETLLKEYACSDDAEDVLARRYYANAILGRINRNAAICIWKKLREGKHVPIDEALGAYDVFARMGDDVGTDVIAEDIGRLATAVFDAYPQFHDLTPRAKASTLATFLRDQGFQGVSGVSYRNLQNSFIGLVLRSATHHSLPLISVAIYCALARHVGLDARPCGSLFHVYTLVYAPANYDLDGNYKPTSSSDLDFMYLDPFRSSDEVKHLDLVRTLRDMGVPAAAQATFLTDTNTREMVLRTARNIMNSVQSIRRLDQDRGIVQPTWFNKYPDMDNAFYATIWAKLILSPDYHTITAPVAIQRHEYLPFLLGHFQTHFPWDVGMLEEHVIPLFINQPEGERLIRLVQSMYHVDSMPKPRITRDPRTRGVKYKVGQLFYHRRYNYEGIITGWDMSCDAEEEWIENMGVDSLPNGRNQAFYHVLVCDKSIRYVAEENINPAALGIEPSEAILHLAGRHFKRWDGENGFFVSNIRDEYPDD